MPHLCNLSLSTKHWGGAFIQDATFAVTITPSLLLPCPHNWVQHDFNVSRTTHWVHIIQYSQDHRQSLHWKGLPHQQQLHHLHHFPHHHCSLFILRYPFRLIGGHLTQDHLGSHQEHCMEMPHTKNEWVKVSSLMDSQAFDIQLMASWREGCFKFPFFVLISPVLLYPLLPVCPHVLLEGPAYTSIHWLYYEVYPPGMMITSELQRSFTFWCCLQSGEVCSYRQATNSVETDMN